MELTNFHLGRAQKAELRKRADARGVTLAQEIRVAVGAYLDNAPTVEEMELLELVSKHVEQALGEMNETLAETNRRAEEIFFELERLRGCVPTR
ncbi:MAG: hypothetical protein ABI605_03785 [Rhizobacter sp.]